MFSRPGLSRMDTVPDKEGDSVKSQESEWRSGDRVQDALAAGGCWRQSEPRATAEGLGGAGHSGGSEALRGRRWPNLVSHPGSARCLVALCGSPAVGGSSQRQSCCH